MYLSVVIPAYNVEKSLARCIDSVLTLQCEKEIIVVNDGSKDNTQKIIDSYTAKTPLVKCIVQTNQGLSAARNSGFSQASGDWILFIDSDDYYDLNLDIEGIINNTDADIIFFGYKRIAETGELLGIRFPQNNHPWKIVSAWSKIYRRSFLKDNNIEFKKGIIYEDTLYTVHLWKHNPKVKITNLAFYNYTVNPKSITSKPHSTKEIFALLKNEKISIFACDCLRLRLALHFIKERILFKLTRHNKKS